MNNNTDNIVRFSKIYYDDLDFTCKYLEDMARQGWMLESIRGTFIFRFVKCEPKNVKFSINIFTKGSVFDTHVVSDNYEYIEYCKKAGWNFVCTTSNTDIFYSDDENAIEIDSDEMIKLKYVKKMFRVEKLLPPILFILACLVFCWEFFTINLNILETDFAIFFGGLFNIVNAVISFAFIIRYLIWCRTADKSVKNGGKIPPLQKYKPNDLKKTFVLIGFSIILFIFVNVVFGIIFESLLYTFIVYVTVIILVLLLLLFGYVIISEKNRFSRLMNRIFSIIVIPGVSVLLILLLAGVFVVFDRDDLHKSNYTFSSEDKKILCGDEDFYEISYPRSMNYGHFMLSYDHVYMFARAKDRNAAYETGKSAYINWIFNVYHTKVKSIYDRLLREADDNEYIRTLGFEYNFEWAERVEELERDGIKVWKYKEDYRNMVTNYDIRYLICDGETILIVNCDNLITPQQFDVIVNKFF